MTENELKKLLEVVAENISLKQGALFYKENRLEYIGELRRKRWTLQKIADEVLVTRERVRQILLTHPDPEVRRTLGLQKKIPDEERMCPICHNTFVCYSTDKKKYCSRECKKQAPRKWASKEEYNRAKYLETKKRYQTDPDYRKYILNRYRNWVNKRETADPSLRERRLTVMKKQAQERQQKKNQERYKIFNELKQRGLSEQSLRRETEEKETQ